MIRIAIRSLSALFTNPTFQHKEHFIAAVASRRIACLFGLAFYQVLFQAPASDAHQEHLRDPNAILINGDFSEGSGLPAHWMYQPRPEVNSQLTLVSDVTHDIPTGAPNFKAQALRLTLGAVSPATPPADVSPVTVSQVFQRKPNRPFNISGWLKTSPGVQAKVMLRAKNEDWTQNVLTLNLTANTYAPDTEGWCYFFESVTLPPSATATILALESNGVGSCWLDNVSVVEAPAP